MIELLKLGDCQKELQIVTRLEEKGHDPLQIAAIALKIARDRISTGHSADQRGDGRTETKTRG